MRCERIAALLSLAALAGCVQTPDIYAPPVQRKPFTIEPQGTLKHFVEMNDPSAAVHLMLDVNDRVEGGGGRWTGKRPVLRFRVPTGKPLRFVADYIVHAVVLNHTGPLTVSISVNNHLLETRKHEKDGEVHFEKRIDPKWIRAGGDTLVSFELDKMFVAEDGARFGLLLVRAGFLD
jgi:hypothetical protein